MADSIFRHGEDLMRSAFNFAACTVSYSRNGVTLASAIPAKLGRTVFRYDSPAGITVRTEQRDFILRFSDLNTEPETGDEILLEKEIFVVSAPNSEPCWKWHTRLSHSEIRIHAKSAGIPPESSSSSSSESSDKSVPGSPVLSPPASATALSVRSVLSVPSVNPRPFLEPA